MKLSNTTHLPIAVPAPATMSSLELVELINEMREPGQAELAHSDFMKKVVKVLGESNAGNFSGIYKDGRNRDKPCYRLPKREASLMVMSESYKVQAAVYDRMVELESKSLFTLPDFTNPAIAARAWADEVEAKQKALEIISKQQSSIAEKDNLILASNEASIKAGEILVREFVKSVDIVDLGEKQFYQWMKKHKLIMDNRQPYQQYVNRGFFTWKPTEEKHGGKYRYTLRITPRGRVWLAAKYMSLLDQDFTI